MICKNSFSLVEVRKSNHHKDMFAKARWTLLIFPIWLSLGNAHAQLHPKEASGGWTVLHLRSIRFRSRDPSQSSMGFRRKMRRLGKENPRNRSVRLGMFARNGNPPGWQSPQTVSLPYPNFRFHMNRARKLSEGGFRMLFWQSTREGMFSNSRLTGKNLN